MSVKRIDREQFEDRIEYLSGAASADVKIEYLRAQAFYQGNHAKVVEVLELISRTAREAAQYLRERA